MIAVGVVGLGAMGGPILRHVRAAGFPTWCVDLDPAAVDAAAALGATGCPSPAALAPLVDVVLLTVPTDQDVLAVATGPAGLLAGLRAGSVLAVCSSVRPETCAKLAAEAAPRQVDVLDSALTGGVRAAIDGTVNLLVGGPAAALGRARPVFDAFCAGVQHLGDLGQGQVGKTVNNLIHWAQIIGIVEALRLGRELGLSPARARAALVHGPTDSRTLRELEQMRFTWYGKDIDNASQMAAGVGLPLPVATLARELMAGITVADVADLLGT
ncbi:MAG TPA: NAD(P)-dependent oxidoreductase [Mycobacteriales bacterium]|nr:NAD(P)-dependent oxidoreductase [Mycobacteriales bacterium]